MISMLHFIVSLISMLRRVMKLMVLDRSDDCLTIIFYVGVGRGRSPGSVKANPNLVWMVRVCILK